MTTEMRLRNQSQQLYVRALSQAWRSSIQVYDPSLWLLRDPEVEEKMLRDPDIAHAVGYRRALIAGRQWQLTPRVEHSPRAPIAVSVGTELLKCIKKFTEARQCLARAFFSGARFGRVHGTYKKMRIGDGKPRSWWVPNRIEDMDKRMYRIVPEHDDQHRKLAAHWERWDVPRQQFVPEDRIDAMRTIRHVYNDDQSTLGHGKALREALGWLWYSKTHVYQEALQSVEKTAGGTIVAKVDGARDAETGLPNVTLMQEYQDVLEDMRARHVLIFDKADEVELLNANSEGWQIFDALLDKMRSSVFTLVLGANLTTSADKGGSFALAEIQENSTEALIQYDRETLEETLTDDLIQCVWWKNHANLYELGLVEEMPRFSITQEKKQDPMERSQVAATLVGMGVDLGAEDLYEQTGFAKPEEGEEIVSGRRGMDLFGGDGLGDSVPDLTDIQPAKPEDDFQDIQETALNGAQVTAAAELIDRVVHNQMPPGTAIRMLVSMFNLPLAEAKAMVDEAVVFQPAATAAPVDPLSQ